jgi:hypothetical protein
LLTRPFYNRAGSKEERRLRMLNGIRIKCPVEEVEHTGDPNYVGRRWVLY